MSKNFAQVQHGEDAGPAADGEGGAGAHVGGPGLLVGRLGLLSLMIRSSELVNCQYLGIRLYPGFSALLCRDIRLNM